MGAAVARRFAAHGPIVICDVNAVDLSTVGDALRITGADVRTVAGDLREQGVLAAIIDAIAETGLDLGGVAHAAGVSPAIGPLVVAGTAVVLSRAPARDTAVRRVG